MDSSTPLAITAVTLDRKSTFAASRVPDGRVTARVYLRAPGIAGHQSRTVKSGSTPARVDAPAELRERAEPIPL